MKYILIKDILRFFKENIKAIFIYIFIFLILLLLKVVKTIQNFAYHLKSNIIYHIQYF